MISAVAFCPHPPLLVPQLAGGAAGEVASLRAACAAAVARVATGPRQLVLLGAGESSRSYSPLARGSLAGYGLPLEISLGAPGGGGALELPPSLTIGAWLVRDVMGPRSGAVGFSVGVDFAASPAALELLALARSEELGVIVLGDGSARRSATAPGYLDSRALDFDGGVAAALKEGDVAALAALDPVLGAELLAAGVPAWRAAGKLLEGGSYDAELLYAADPYGVGYYVAVWTAGV